MLGGVSDEPALRVPQMQTLDHRAGQGDVLAAMHTSRQAILQKGQNSASRGIIWGTLGKCLIPVQFLGFETSI